MEIQAGLEDKVSAVMKRAEKTLIHSLGIEFSLLSKSRLLAQMPVDERTRQPFGLLHGGASVALAETLASVGGWLNVTDPEKVVVGIEINANHVRSVRSGFVVGEAEPIHLGGKIQVWKVSITNEDGELVCESRCTLAVIAS